MEIKEYINFNPQEIMELYAAVGWTNYTKRPQMLEQAYKKSLLKLGAYDEEKLVGIIRAVGDGESIVFVQDILVLPEYQRKGIGTQLLRTVMERFSSVYQLELMTDNTEKTNAFYKSLGFVRVDEIGCCAYMKLSK